MQTIHPIHAGDRGPAVANLHNALLFIFFHESGVSHATRKALRDRLAPDVLNETYGDATTELVGLWQNQLKNWPNYFHPLPRELAERVRNTFSPTTGTGRGNGDVDQVTADALNWFIRTLGGH
ncbi:hypothetical protein [Bradyrhizobium sp. BWA-3-5]|uniref:hypothetical protein n=1 Tax=Bradyrhizobium sp. BWA-3-5 TaxID=3080013 RepID=UPI00293EB63D|nr:hypothetical protein [Bradyrhizobium sp. BWA-3-5]WOH69604.1 hypothetical protein RX331_18705 [Bradyrhizobium sp. BWA-3-5]